MMYKLLMYKLLDTVLGVLLWAIGRVRAWRPKS